MPAQEERSTNTLPQIGYHLQAYTDPATAPFHRAIMESGGPTARATLSPSHPRTATQWREFLLAAGIQPHSTPPAQIFPLLRALPLDVLLRASGAVFARYQDPIRWPFQPVIESAAASSSSSRGGTTDAIISDLPINKFRRGEFLRIPVLTGFNSNEGTVFCSPRVDRDDEFLAKFTTMIPGLSAADLVALSRVYPDPTTSPGGPHARVPPGFGRQWARYEAAYAHYAYICPVLQGGHFWGNAGERRGDDGDGGEGRRPPVWVYHFAALSRPDFGGKANHVDEAALVAHDMGALAPHPGLVRTADVMHGAWVRFVATGDPNPTTPSPSAAAAACPPALPLPERQQQQEWWPRFRSPFVGDTEGLSPGRLLRRGNGDGEGAVGRVMMFGRGNDERMGDAGRRAPGEPAVVVGLTEGEAEECRYWWERVELSEGMGRIVRGDRARL